MLDVVIISSDEEFAGVLCEACEGNENVHSVKKATIEELSGLKCRNGVVLLVVEDVREGLRQVVQIAEIARDVQVVGVMRADDPELAFDMIAQGAYHALAVPMRGNASLNLTASEMLQLLLYPLLAELVLGKRQSRLSTAKLDGDHSVFVSMRYESTSRSSKEECDYGQAIVPALKRLGVDHDLSRARRNYHGQTLNAKLLSEIHQSRIMLVLASNMSEYVAYEIGAADSALRIRNNPAVCNEVKLEDMFILCPASSTPPPVASELHRLIYVNRTDLALKLYLALGGTVDDLRKHT